MPVINTGNPFDDAAGAVGGYLQGQTAAKQAAQQLALQQAAAAQQARMQQQQMDLEQKRFNAERSDAKFNQDRETKEDELRARAEADRELDKAREDAMKAAQLRYQQTKDERTYRLQVLKINTAHQDEQAKLKSAQTVAQIHAQATMGAASISAAAHIQAAGIMASAAERDTDAREAGEDRRAGARLKVEERGQDLRARAKASAGADSLSGKSLASKIGSAFSKAQISPKVSLTIQSLVQSRKASYKDLVRALKGAKSAPAGTYPISPDDADAALSALGEDDE